ncbi:hypothetical protein BV22DRAFT_1043007 [Leucogyrophana mollusca]|uniref:Uncharacterized protein n=1 Tax=Leucogyrophana mollusca TaxID=85980 RepID=A0ACB8BY84_9AGAM|nr:hypothetical protein BV22DRAFT_1043007 [Leucogyrophana mollusca]
MSQTTSNPESGSGSPEAQFHMPRADSPSNIDFNSHHHNDTLLQSSQFLRHHVDSNHHQHQNSEPLYAQSAGHSMYNSTNNYHIFADPFSDSDSFPLKQQQGGSKSPNDFGAGPFRSSFSAYSGMNGGSNGVSGAPNGASRLRQPPAPQASQSFSNGSDFGAHQPLGLQHQLSQQSQQGQSAGAFDARGFDFGGNTSLGVHATKSSQQYALDPFLQAHASKSQSQSQGHDGYIGHSLGHSASTAQMPYLNGMHLQSQTPYGPHLQSNGAGQGLAVGSSRGLGSTGQINTGAEGQSGNGAGQQEEISTIFVVGFPEDMQEREFQNMFTFSAGFEAATLKIPNKEYTAYGSSGGTAVTTPSGIPLRGSSSYAQYLASGSNDPYNLVTVNQGGVVVDNGRDGPTTSWPPLPLEDPSPFPQGVGPGGLGGQPPRKQIIGFAKFRTRQEALDARDVLQGRRVDIEKGAVLKAEMAKKNLHTKRGVGMGTGTGAPSGVSGMGGGGMGLGGGGGTMGSIGGLGVNTDTLAGLAAGLNLNSNINMNSLAALGANADIIGGRDRDIGSLSGIGLGGLGWREGRLGDSSEEERERRRDTIGAMGLGLGIGMTRGARERAQEHEEERERERQRRKELKQQSDAARMLSGNSAAFDAFHSVPATSLSRHSQNGLLSPSTGSVSMTGLGEGGSTGTSPMLGNGYGGIIAQTGSRDELTSPTASSGLNGHREAIGPWDAPSPKDREMNNAPQSLSSLYGPRKQSMAPVRTPSSQQDSPPNTFSPTLNDDDRDPMLPQHRPAPLRSVYASSFGADESLQVQAQQFPHASLPPSSATSSVGLDGERAGPLAVTTSAQPGSAGSTSPQLPSPASNSGSAVSSSIGGGNGGGSGSATSAGGANGTGSGPRNAAVDQNPPINTLYVGNLPTGSVGGGYPAGYLEESLRELFQRRPGYRKLCFRQKSNGPMCFVEFEDVQYASRTLSELYGNTLGGLVKNGGIRLSYSKNPLGVRTPTSAGNGSSSLQQQQHNAHQGVVSPFPAEAFQPRHSFDIESSSAGMRRDSSATSPLPSAYSYSRSPPPPRFFSPSPPSTSFGMSSASLANASAFPRGSHNFGLPSPNGTGASSTFSPFGLPLSPHQSNTFALSHSSIPDQMGSDVPLGHDHQHFPHRALSPSSSNTLEAARAG